MLQRWTDIAADRLRRSRDDITLEALGLVRSLHPRSLRRLVAAAGPRWTMNLAVSILVLSLPLAATAATGPGASAGPTAGSLIAASEAPRAQAIARGATISAARNPVTVQSEDVRPIHEYTLGKTDTLGSVANFYGVSPEALAFANGITDPLHLEVGRTIRVPPGDGALYTVAEGDTVETVAERFKVQPAAIEEYNRLYFEPEHFATGQLVFVPGATLPALVYETVDAEPEVPTVIARAPAPVAAPASTGRLVWPTGGRITQYFWYAHTGVDLAAPYGTGLGAAADGTVSATGWVPVGGLRVCVKHDGGIESCYYHTGAVFVTPGQKVARGQIVATIGMTGVTTGPHVHWETKLNGVFVNPLGL
jgi:murein DD-endopeptidase MepM/ murein hydrolase activator NlpD